MVRELAYTEKSEEHTKYLLKHISDWDRVCAELRPLLEKRKEKGLPPIKLVCTASIDYEYKGKVES